MTATLSNRKLVELTQKLDSLEAEFAYWLQQSQAKKSFEKHNSQVLAITAILNQLQKDVRGKIEAAKTPEQILAVGQPAAQMMLAVHRIWEYFRSKFIQRREERLAKYLQAADEFAWACYQPVLECANAVQAGKYRREPPLVFFNGGSSPFSVSRQRSFEGEAVPNELLSGPKLREVLKSLPIPVIGVPWFQVAHLPDALVVGHEVGHTVEDDFGLTDSLQAQLQTVMQAEIDPAHHDAWKAWTGELFADLFGCVATGPAFVASLRDFLLRTTTALQQENRIAPNWGDYPTQHLRMLCNFAALRAMKFVAEEEALRTAWLTHCPTAQLSDYERDVEVIVAALLHHKFPQLGQKSLLEFEFPHPDSAAVKVTFCFSQDQQQKAVQTALALKQKEPLKLTADFRVLLAASRLAFENDPAGFVSEQYAERILARIKDITKPGTRANERNKSKPQVLQDKQQDTQTGSDLFATLWTQAENEQSQP